jgi:hypothetical protein
LLHCAFPKAVIHRKRVEYGPINSRYADLAAVGRSQGFHGEITLKIDLWIYVRGHLFDGAIQVFDYEIDFRMRDNEWR